MGASTKRTPGPWTAEANEEDPGFFQVWADKGGTGFTVADGIGEEANARLIAAAPSLLAALAALNHMGGDERGGYCVCPRNDGSAPDEKHSTACGAARAAIAAAEGR